MVYKVTGIRVWANKPFDISRGSHKRKLLVIKKSGYTALRAAGTYFLTQNSNWLCFLQAHAVNDVCESTEALIATGFCRGQGRVLVQHNIIGTVSVRFSDIRAD